MGGGAFHPRRKRQAGGWEQGRACTQGQGHRARWPEAGLGKGTTGAPARLRAALASFLAGEGLEANNQFHPLPSLSRPEQVRHRKGLLRGRRTGPPGLSLHLPWSPSKGLKGVY